MEVDVTELNRKARLEKANRGVGKEEIERVPVIQDYKWWLKQPRRQRNRSKYDPQTGEVKKRNRL